MPDKPAEKEPVRFTEANSVLIVDDDRIIRQELQKELKRQYFNPLIAADGKSALEIFREEEIDIVLLDVKLPDINGIDVLQQMKEEKPGSEIIVITGLGTQEIAIRSLRAGAIDYIEKPIAIEELSAALGRAREKLEEREEIFYKYRLLLVDDEEEIVKLLKRALEKEGFEVLTAYSGREGLKVIETMKIDILITDIKMPDMDGIEVLKRAKKLYQDIEGIVITGFADQDLAIKSLRAGAKDYIIKPVNLDELLFSIQGAIEKINLNRDRLYRSRELKISSEIISKMNEELERRIEERSSELSQTQAQLFQTSKLATLGEMSAGLAHEMNQPLGGISLVAKHMRKLLERQRLTEEEIDAGLSDIEASVKRMAKVIQHIRTFARQDALKFMEVDVNDTIDSALSLLGEQLRLREIDVVWEPKVELPKITGEPYQLEQVWINLIGNARDALDEKEKKIDAGEVQMSETDYRKKLSITVNHHPQGDIPGVVVRFDDNGIGLEEEQAPKIFEPFFTTKEVGKAMGLGLSISHGIIENHKGKFEVESEPTVGTTFRVVLPEKGNPA